MTGSRRRGSAHRGSALDRIEQRTGRRVRLNLHDADDDSTPVLKPGPGRAQPDGRYHIVGEIARGGVGVVYKSRDMDLGRDVAMKVLKENLASDSNLLQRFVEEAQIGGQLQHPGIVPVYELGLQADQRPYFTMKLVKGQTLAALLRRRPDLAHDRRRFLGIFEQVCETMAYAHSRKVVHRDLKPSNVMVGAYGEVQIVDWGFAKVLARQDESDKPDEPAPDVSVIQTVRSGSPGSDSQAGSVLGTPAYMPPEQAWGAVDHLDERSDVFALGAILCEILTGKPPYVAEGSEILMKAAGADLAEAYRGLDASGADRELVDLAKDCLQKDRDDRPESAETVARRISGHLAAVKERARRAELATAEARVRADGDRRARRLTLGVAAVVLLALALGGGAYWKTESRRLEVLAQNAQEVRTALDEALGLADTAREQGTAGLETWDKARIAAQKALATAREKQTDTPVLEEVESALDEIDRGRRVAEMMAAQEREDREMVAKLDELRLLRGETNQRNVTAADYVKVFAGYGIDVTGLSDDEIVQRVRASAIRERLVHALLRWSEGEGALRGGAGDGGERVLEICIRSNDDETLHEILRAVRVKDLEALQALAQTQEARLLVGNTPHILQRQLLKGGDWEGSVEMLRYAVRHRPDDYRLNFILANRLQNSRPPLIDEALSYYQAAVALRPTSTIAAYEMGKLLEQTEDLDSAIEMWEHAIRTRPDRIGPYTKIMQGYRKQGRLAEVITRLKAEVDDEPEDGLARFKLAIALQTAGRPDAALEQYLHARTLERRNIGFAWQLGVLHMQQRRWRDAQQMFKEAIDLDPRWFVPHSTLARLYAKIDDYEKAIDAYEAVLHLKPASATFHKESAVCHLRLGKLEKARGLLERAAELNKSDPAIPYNLAVVHRTLREFDRCIELCDQAQELRNDEFGDAYVVKGTALLQNAEFGDAVANLEWAKEYGAERAAVLDLARRCEALDEEEEDAVFSGGKTPESESEAAALAWFCTYKGRPVAGAAYYRKWLETGAVNADLCYDAACVYALASAAQNGLTADARTKLRADALARMGQSLEMVVEGSRESGFPARSAARKRLLRMRRDPDLSAVRDAEALVALLAAERKSWEVLWQRLDAALEELQE